MTADLAEGLGKRICRQLRFRDEATRTRHRQLMSIRARVTTRDQHDLRRSRVGREQVSNLKAVHVRQLNIEQDNRRSESFTRRQSAGSFANLPHNDIAAVLEKGSGEPAEISIVVHDEHSLAHTRTAIAWRCLRLRAAYRTHLARSQARTAITRR